MTPTGYAFLGLSVLVAMVVAVLVFAVLRFASAARSTRRLVSDDSDNPSTLLASALEDTITHLKAKERATAARAAASELLSSSIVASLTSGLIVVDSRGTVQIVNPAAQRLLDLEDAPGPAETILRATPALRDIIEESLRNGTPILRRTIVLERPAGSMHLGVTVSPLAAGDGQSGAICIFRDLTSVMALEEQLRLKEALARLGELTAGLAHEFRNGLATIHGYARLLDPAQLPDAQQPYLAGIREETQALDAVVTNFLNFARPAPLTLISTDLRTVVERAAADVPAATVEIAGDFAWVDADDVLLRQAVSNLFRNSVEACAAKGVAPAVCVHGHIDADRRAVVVTVADDGPGIDDRALPRLFQPFFTTRPGGTGLGLAIVQKIIVSHNGSVTAANRREGGAVFTVTLPSVFADRPSST
jgi:signal transduction histidine kinase